MFFQIYKLDGNRVFAYALSIFRTLITEMSNNALAVTAMAVTTSRWRLLPGQYVLIIANQSASIWTDVRVKRVDYFSIWKGMVRESQYAIQCTRCNIHL
jgi:hypothetical protein